MNDLVDQKLADFIDKALNGIDSTVDFFGDQLPDYVSQLLVWYTVSSAIDCFVGVIMLSLCVIVPYKHNKWCNKQFEEGAKWTKHSCYNTTSTEWDLRFMPLILLIFPAVFGLFMINMEWLQIMVAPKVWLVEYAKDIIK